MQTVIVDNLLDIDSLIDSFIMNHHAGIVTMHRIYFHNDNAISIRALIAELTDQLRTGCVTFFNKHGNEADPKELDAYLFYIVNAFCKQKATPLVKKKTEYLCPGCLFLGKDNLITFEDIFKCDDCESELRSTKDPKRILFFKTFFKHYKNGYHCQDCQRFIPHPLDNASVVSCPYFDCCFVGPWSSLKRMHHPTSQNNPEKLILDRPLKDSNQSLIDTISSGTESALSILEIQENLQQNLSILKEVIESQSNNVPYSGSEITAKHKILVYQAFSNLLGRYPEEMVDYLLNNSRSGGFQHKIFQEYILLLEKALPYSFKKNNKMYRINSLLDENLCLFDGISVFDEIVSDKLEIKNKTQEFYIGGRKASYTKPYYIGKLLNVADKINKTSLLSQVVEYSFSKIKMKDIVPGTEVTVTHLRVPPHYQMGGMVYINRIRKKIIDRAHILLNKENNV
jgi:hypothetical protein